MRFKFNGGNGAILCRRCGRILLEGSNIPDYVWDAVGNGTVRELPDMYCDDNCAHTKKVLGDDYIDKK